MSRSAKFLAKLPGPKTPTLDLPRGEANKDRFIDIPIVRAFVITALVRHK